MNDLPVGTIVLDGASKLYRLGTPGTLRGTLEALMQRARDGESPGSLWALKDVSFRVEPGESLGLIGPNGAGKTTTLKLLSKITQPTSGRITVSGRTSSLIELGAGFHPELTGRENIFLNGAILGLTRHEIQRKLDEIIAFSELERFMDTPVKRYSSGMYVRLGFAVAAHVEPEILLVDEVLAVGDARFRSKCIQHIGKLQVDGTTIVLVSHNLHQIREVCDSAILLVNGQVVSRGSTARVLREYGDWVSPCAQETALSSSASDALNPDLAGLTRSDVAAVSVEILPSEAAEGYLVPHANARARISYRLSDVVGIGRVHLALYKADHTLCCIADSAAANGLFDPGKIGGAGGLGCSGVIEIVFTPLQLTAGRYYAIVRVTDVSDVAVIASAQSSMFTVARGGPGDHSGVFVPRTQWRFETGRRDA